MKDRLKRFYRLDDELKFLYNKMYDTFDSVEIYKIREKIKEVKKEMQKNKFAEYLEREIRKR